MNFRSIFQFFLTPPCLPPRWNRMARVDWAWVFPFPRSVGLWFTGFPWGQALLRTECSGIFQNALLPTLFQKPELTFLWYLLWESGRASWSKSHSSVRTALHHDCVPLQCWTLRVVLTETPAISQPKFRFSFPGTGLHAVVSAGKSLRLLYSPAGLSNLGCSSLWIQEELLISICC